MQQAILSSTLSSEAHREDLTCSLEPHNLIQHLHLIQMAGQSPEAQVPLRPSPGLTGVEALTLDFRVQWPLSILLSRRAITKYQLLSRILFFSKYVEVCSLHLASTSPAFVNMSLPLFASCRERC